MSPLRQLNEPEQGLPFSGTFYRAWLRNPRRMGAVVPSGTALARLITAEINAMHAPVLELGPGTGVFTHMLLQRGVAEAQITLVEKDDGLAHALRRRFPAARILHANAAHLGCESLYPEGAGAVISGLPLLSLSHSEIFAVLGGVFAQLRRDAAMYQFTYGLRCPVPRPILDRLGLKARLTGRTLANIPPACVYRITRRGSLLLPHP
jgi:phospholipid N-methyltransferase